MAMPSRSVIWWVMSMPQRPEAVKHLGDPVVIAFHQAGEVEALVPLAQQDLELFQLLQLLRIGAPAEALPQIPAPGVAGVW